MPTKWFAKSILFYSNGQQITNKAGSDKTCFGVAKSFCYVCAKRRNKNQTFPQNLLHLYRFCPKQVVEPDSSFVPILCILHNLICGSPKYITYFRYNSARLIKRKSRNVLVIILAKMNGSPQNYKWQCISIIHCLPRTLLYGLYH